MTCYILLIILLMNLVKARELNKKEAIIKVVLTEPKEHMNLKNGDFQFGTRIHSVTGEYSSVGKLKDAEGTLVQVHPVELCKGFYSPPYKHWWIAFVRLEEPKSDPRNCRTSVARARKAFKKGAKAVIFDVSRNPSAGRQLVSYIPRSILRGPVILLKGNQADILKMIIKQNDMVRASIVPRQKSESPKSDDDVDSKAVSSDSPETLPTVIMETPNDDVSFSVAARGYMSIFLVLFLAIITILLLIIIKIKWCKRNSEYTITQLAKQAISQMETKKYKSSDNYVAYKKEPSKHSFDSNSESCAVCLDEYQDGEEIRVLPCNHEFHKLCVDPWLLSNQTCPLCIYDIIDEPSKYVKKRSCTIPESQPMIPPSSHSMNLLQPDAILRPIDGLNRRRMTLVFPVTNNRQFCVPQSQSCNTFRHSSLCTHQPQTSTIHIPSSTPSPSYLPYTSYNEPKDMSHDFSRNELCSWQPDNMCGCDHASHSDCDTLIATDTQMHNNCSESILSSSEDGDNVGNASVCQVTVHNYDQNNHSKIKQCKDPTVCSLSCDHARHSYSSTSSKDTGGLSYDSNKNLGRSSFFSDFSIDTRHSNSSDLSGEQPVKTIGDENNCRSVGDCDSNKMSFDETAQRLQLLAEDEASLICELKLNAEASVIDSAIVNNGNDILGNFTSSDDNPYGNVSSNEAKTVSGSREKMNVYDLSDASASTLGEENSPALNNSRQSVLSYSEGQRGAAPHMDQQNENRVTDIL